MVIIWGHSIGQLLNSLNVQRIRWATMETANIPKGVGTEINISGVQRREFGFHL